MTYTFTLIDIEDGGTEHQVTEPINFDSKLILKRDPTWFGIFFEFSLKQFEFTDEVAMGILETRYEQYSEDAQVNIRIDTACAENQEKRTAFTGRINFNQYKKKCADYCSISVGVEADGCLMQLKRNIDQKVNLETTESFDGTPLTAYPMLPYDGTLLAKSIKLLNEAKATTDLVTQVDQDPDYNILDGTTGTVTGIIIPPLDQNAFNEYDTFATLPTADYVAGNAGDLTTNNAFYKHEPTGALKCLGDEVQLTVKGQFVLKITSSATWNFTGSPAQNNLIIGKRVGGAGAVIIYQAIAPSSDTTSGFVRTLVYDVDTDDTIPVAVDDELYMYFFLSILKSTTGEVFIECTTKAGADLKQYMLSTCDPTPCKMFLINEALSRTAEAITNDCLRVYSEYFGRRDSMPYQTATDGCGSLEALSMGLLVRQVDTIKDTGLKPVFSLSFKEILDAMNAIHCVGMGLEPDTNRPGSQRIRVEPGQYFFQDEVGLDLGEVAIEKQAQSTLMYNIFKFGYAKWESEEFNGLDEFLTAREYRLNMDQASQMFEQECRFIASGYALEITRRVGHENTKDWRFDDDTFIICLKRGPQAPGAEIPELVVEQGNLTDAENILDPDTIINGRISPIRMALNWAWYLWQQYKTKNWPGAKMIFTKGEANYNATFAITNDCRKEGGPLSEKGEISLATFFDPQDGTPLFGSERDKISVGISELELLTILENPYKKVKYTNQGNTYYGWIEEIQYELSTQVEAEITIIPEFTGS